MKNKIKKTLAVMAIMAMALSSVGCACGKPSAEDSKNNNSVITEKEESSKVDAKNESSKVNSKDESSKTNSKEESSKATSKDESSKTTSKEESSKAENSKTTSTESSKTQGGNNSTTNNPSGGSGNTGNTTTQGCTHDWVQQYKTVHHDAVTHTEQVQTGTKTVVDQEGYEYEEVIGEQAYILFSDGTEWEYDYNNIPADFEEQIGIYMSEHFGVSYGVYSRPIYETRYVEPVTHEEPVYETRTVVDKDAYDEQVANGSKCSKCGATK